MLCFSMSRRALAALFAVLGAAPAAGQVRAVPTVGVDAGYGAPMTGLAVEVGVGRLPVAVRPAAEFVFPSAFADDTGDTPVVRVALDAVARLNPADVLSTPHVVVGVAAERERRSTFSGAERMAFDTSVDRVGVGVRAGAGVRLGRLVAEATLGAGGAGRGRFLVGVRL